MNGQRGNVRKTDMKNQLFALLKWFYMIFFFNCRSCISASSSGRLNFEFTSSVIQTGRKRRQEGCSVVTRIRILGSYVDRDDVCLCLCPIISIRAHLKEKENESFGNTGTHPAMQTELNEK